MPSEIKLTDREVAIAKGEDPDDVVAEVVSGEPVETPQDDPVDEPVSEPEAVTEPENWVDNDAKYLAASYGLGEDDLKAFSSMDDLRKHTYLIDKQIYDEAAASQKAGDEPQPVDNQKAVEAESEDLIDPQKYADDGYDDETIKLAKALRRQQEVNLENQKLLQEINGWRQGFEEQMAQQEMVQVTNEFHRAIDMLGDERLGRAYDESGSVAELSKEVHAQREKVWEAMKVLENGIYARAKEKGTAAAIPPRDVLVQRAYQLAFPEAVKAKARQRTIETAKAQSAKRRPVGNQGATRTRNVEALDRDSLAKHPDIEQWWKENVLS